MKKYVLTILLSCFLPLATWAQDVSTPAKQQRVMSKVSKYGSLHAGGGFNFFGNSGNENLDHRQSRFVNLQAIYNTPLWTPHLVLGLGMGWESGRWTKEINSSSQGSKEEKLLRDYVDLHYLDFLVVELRLNANAKYPKESLFGAVGTRLGMLWDASRTERSKIGKKHSIKIEKDKSEMEETRWVVYAHMGLGRVGACYAYNFTGLHKEASESSYPHYISVSFDLF